MANEIITTTDWQHNNLLQIYTANEAENSGIKSLWLKYYTKLHRHRPSANSIKITYDRFIRDINSWGRNYDLYAPKIQKLITELIITLLKQHPIFTLRHMKIYQEKTSKTRIIYCIYFNDTLISFILQQGLENKIIEQYLIYKTLETEQNKQDKIKELDSLLNICKKQITEVQR